MPAGRRFTAGGVLAASFAAATGLAVALRPTLGILGLTAAGAALIGVLYPVSLVALMYVAMLFDRLGVTGLNIDQFPITASKLSVLGGLGLWAAHVLLRGARPVRWHPVLAALVGVVIATAVSIALANCMQQGKYDLAGLAMMVVLVAFVHAVLAEARLEPLYRFLAGTLLAICAFSLAPTGGGRATGTFGDPNEWGTMLLLLGPTLLGGLAEDRHPVARPLRVLLLLLAPVMILRTGSRSALVVGCLAAPAWIALLRRHRGELGASLAAAAIASPFAIGLDSAWQRLRQLFLNLQGLAVVPDPSLEERTELARQGWALFFDRWLLGAGPGTFPEATGFISSTGTLRPAHNTYLQIACEQGLLGLTVFAVLAGIVVLTLRRAWRTARDPAARSRVLGVSIGLASLALMAATLGLLTFSMAYLVLGLALAVCDQAEANRVLPG